MVSQHFHIKHGGYLVCSHLLEARLILGWIVKSQMNPWLTYFPELHAIREGGTNLSLLDRLDERPFTGGEVGTFLSMLMLCKDDPPLPAWEDFQAFMDICTAFSTGKPNVYDPFDKQMKSMMDANEVRKAIQGR